MGYYLLFASPRACQAKLDLWRGTKPRTKSKAGSTEKIMCNNNTGRELKKFRGRIEWQKSRGKLDRLAKGSSADVKMGRDGHDSANVKSTFRFINCPPLTQNKSRPRSVQLTCSVPVISGRLLSSNFGLVQVQLLLRAWLILWRKGRSSGAERVQKRRQREAE